MPTIYQEVEIDVELCDFETDDLIEELTRRDSGNYMPRNDLVQSIFEKRRAGKDYQKELDDLIYNTIGRVV
jgi:phosphate-selective porin